MTTWEGKQLHSTKKKTFNMMNRATFFHDCIFVLGGLLTPIPTPTNVSPTGTQDMSVKPQISKVPNPLPLPIVTTGTLTPDSSPLGVLSPAATTAAVSMAMNGAKRPLSTSQPLTNSEEEHEIKRQKLSQPSAAYKSSPSQPETADQGKL